MAVISSINGNAFFGDGIIISSPNGTLWKVYVDDTGAIQTEEVTS